MASLPSGRASISSVGVKAILAAFIVALAVFGCSSAAAKRDKPESKSTLRQLLLGSSTHQASVAQPDRNSPDERSPFVVVSLRRQKHQLQQSAHSSRGPIAAAFEAKTISDGDKTAHLDKDNTSDDDVESDDEKCGPCVCGAIATAIDIAVNAQEKMCKAEKVNQGTLICRLLKDDREAAEGFIAQEVPPVLSGFAYCVGSGECVAQQALDIFTQPPLATVDQCETPLDDDPSDASSAFDEVAGCIARYPLDLFVSASESKHSLHFSDFGIANTVTDFPLPLLSSPSSLSGIGLTGLQVLESPSDCEHCVQIMMRHVIRFVAKQLDNLCKNVNPHAAPTVSRICHVIETHPHFAAGYLIGTMRPWNFAKGYCVGIDACPNMIPAPSSITGDDEHKVVDMDSPAMEMVGEKDTAHQASGDKTGVDGTDRGEDFGTGDKEAEAEIGTGKEAEEEAVGKGVDDKAFGVLEQQSLQEVLKALGFGVEVGGMAAHLSLLGSGEGVEVTQ